MTNAEILSHIDHTLLKPDAKWADIEQLCREALTYHTASVCIPPYYTEQVKKAFPDLNVCTVIGFPLGYQQTDVKVFEAQEAVSAGADEIDMVINVSLLKNYKDSDVYDEIKQIRTAAEGKILKVIIETCLLTVPEKARCCMMINNTGADYIKTSTGFGSAGAQLADIALFKKYLRPHVKIKAAGGIRTREQMEAFLAAGCDRIGTSAAGILFEQQ